MFLKCYWNIFAIYKSLEEKDVCKREVRMEEIIKLDKSDLSAVADLYRKAFMGEPWNDDWSDRSQLEEYIKDVSGDFQGLNYEAYFFIRKI